MELQKIDKSTFDAQEKNLLHETEQISTPPSLLFSRRFVVSVILFVSLTNVAILRYNISIAVVEMTSAKQIETDNTIRTQPPEFDWDSKDVGLVLSILYCGGVATWLGGYVVTKLGGAVTTALSMMLSGLTTILHPLSLNYGFYSFVICRFFTGIFDGFMMVGVLELYSKWLPQSERSKIISFIGCGMNLGMTIVHGFCAFLAHYWGWSMIFYATGTISVIVSLICLIFVKNRPSEDKWISKKELVFIQQETAACPKEGVVHPHKKILLSRPVWALLITRFTSIWVLTILVACVPLYIKDITQHTTSKVGIISSIPNSVGIFMLPICGLLMNRARNANISETLVHKVLISISFIFCAALFMGAVFVSDFIAALISFILMQMMIPIVSLALEIVTINIAPNHTSVIAGFSLVAMASGSVMARTATGFMIPNHSSKEWNDLFILSSGILTLSAVIFLLYGSSKPQPWSTNYTSPKSSILRQNDIENHPKKVMKSVDEN